MIPIKALKSIFIDLIKGLPKSNAMNLILLVIDIIIKYAHFIALAYPFGGTKVVEIFMNTVLRLHSS